MKILTDIKPEDYNKLDEQEREVVRLEALAAHLLINNQAARKPKKQRVSERATNPTQPALEPGDRVTVIGSIGESVKVGGFSPRRMGALTVGTVKHRVMDDTKAVVVKVGKRSGNTPSKHAVKRRKHQYMIEQPIKNTGLDEVYLTGPDGDIIIGTVERLK